jgi:co-chaperonin GroES (HSP10)
MTTLTPLGDNIICSLIEPAGMAGPIIIPEKHRKTSDRGIVVAIGPKQEEVKPGDCVIITEFVGTAIRIGNRKFVVVPHRNILGIDNSDR